MFIAVSHLGYPLRQERHVSSTAKAHRAPLERRAIDRRSYKHGAPSGALVASLQSKTDFSGKASLTIGIKTATAAVLSTKAEIELIYHRNHDGECSSLVIRGDGNEPCDWRMKVGTRQTFSYQTAKGCCKV